MIMKTRLTLLGTLAISLMGFTAQAQKAFYGTVKGKIAAQDKPVEAASVALLKAADSSIFKLAVSDKEGQYEIDNIKQGKYLLSVKAAGHITYYGKTFEIAETNQSYESPVINLQILTKELAAVTVVSAKPLIEQKLDRTIVNVDASVTNAGATAMEVLEKSPGITVDKDGNISLKGKQGVQVFIDGRPTYLSGQDLANMLRNMQSAQLDQLEIMTNPPAKYDAAGNSGVINIKTKKNKQVGYNGSVTAGYGQGVFPKTNESANLNYRNGSVNIFGNLGYSHRERFQRLDIQRKFTDDITKTVKSNFDQSTDIKNKDDNWNGKLGMDYYASKKTTIGFVMNGSSSIQNQKSTGIIHIADPLNNLLSQTNALSVNQQKWNNLSSNINMHHLIDSTGTEITADLDYIQYDSKNPQTVTNQYFNAAGGPLAGAKPDTLFGSLPQNIAIYSAKVDYVHPLKNGAKIEAGWKSSYVKTDNNATYDSLINNALVHDYGRSNHFIYEENINAAYVNVSSPISKKISAQLGLRAEHTLSKGNQLTNGIVFNRNYVQLFPTLYLQFQKDAKNTFVFNYGKRVGRPDYEDLNPFVGFLDRYTFQQGNPYLQPQISHNLELSHTFMGFLTTTLNYTKTTDIIQDVLEQNSAKNETLIKKSNIANQRQSGISVNAFFKYSKTWSNNIYANLYNNEYQGIINGEAAKTNNTTAVFNVSEQFSFKKGWGAELSGFYRTAGIEGILKIEALGAMNMGVTKQVLKNKGSLRLGVRDVLWSQRVHGASVLNSVNARFQQFNDTRVINLSFTYRFNKGKVGNTQRKRGGANEEADRVKTGNGN